MRPKKSYARSEPNNFTLLSVRLRGNGIDVVFVSIPKPRIALGKLLMLVSLAIVAAARVLP